MGVRQYAVGGGYYVTDIDTHIRYETPSKEKLNSHFAP
ncbi:hypothetical protein EP10_001835 [Geobacillus icigianus]|uniref:N-acetylmuramoyl-L-alanine amidase n=1 Tax=Geobacillus icigianus TaxID=1430331 RepID=A0ABU6BH16_9BACL|nr:2',3'-cyclic-nucleotide 2'-phosphodiesterase [Geobacillus sp. B4113_201601]MEB3750994.1 hypothetical protein [Geobacillus icigianus]